VSLYRRRHSNIAKYFLMDVDLVYCNNAGGMMEELQLQHAPEE
jgi:hypothetical protein